MPGETQGHCDPRSRLAREKYFCLRPRPLERWLWSKRIPASAERVFWLHWQEGMQRGDWCSEIPLSRVARECDLDVSTVTRAYQVLARLDCLRRTDQGRDPANPFQQATALTEVRIPRELLLELNRHPNRRANCNPSNQAGRGREVEAQARDPRSKSCPTAMGTATAIEIAPSAVVRDGSVAGMSSGTDSIIAATDIRMDGANDSVANQGPDLQQGGPPVDTPATQQGEGTGTASGAIPKVRAITGAADLEPLADPFPGLTGRERVHAISNLVDSLSAAERHAYQEALRLHHPTMQFDAHSTVPPSVQAALQKILAAMCRSHSANKDCNGSRQTQKAAAKSVPPRKLTAFELARLSRQLQSGAGVTRVPELMRQVVWSIEVGALKRFDIRHAVHIALKAIREGRWTRPNRMPPNWVHP